MRLRLVTEVSFQHSEADNFVAICKKEKIELGPNDLICLKSLTGTQLVFMFRPREMNLEKFGRQGTATVFQSIRLRLTRSTWNPLMLQNYAAQVGLSIDGLRRFEEMFPNLQPDQGIQREGAVMHLPPIRKAA